MAADERGRVEPGVDPDAERDGAGQEPGDSEDEPGEEAGEHHRRRQVWEGEEQARDRHGEAAADGRSEGEQQVLAIEKLFENGRQEDRHRPVRRSPRSGRRGSQRRPPRRPDQGVEAGDRGRVAREAGEPSQREEPEGPSRNAIAGPRGNCDDEGRGRQEAREQRPIGADDRLQGHGKTEQQAPDGQREEECGAEPVRGRRGSLYRFHVQSTDFTAGRGATAELTWFYSFLCHDPFKIASRNAQQGMAAEPVGSSPRLRDASDRRDAQWTGGPIRGNMDITAVKPGSAAAEAGIGAETARRGFMVRLSVDFENASKTWWEQGGQELWDGITEGFDGSSVVVDESLAESWLETARKIPGWDDGPEYAPNPITVTEVDEFEEDF